MLDYYRLEEEIIRVVDSLDERDVPMKAYAQTYARHIVAAIEEGAELGDSPANALRTQLLYVLSNLEGAPEEALRAIQRLAADFGVDLSGAVREMLQQLVRQGAHSGRYKPRSTKPRRKPRAATRRRKRSEPEVMEYVEQPQQSGPADYEAGFSAARRAVALHGFAGAARMFVEEVEPTASPEYAEGFSNGLHEQEVAYHRASVVPELDIDPTGRGRVPVVSKQEADVEQLRGQVLTALDNVIKDVHAGRESDPMELIVAQGVAEDAGENIERVMQIYISDPREVPAHVIAAALHIMHTHVLRASPQQLVAYRDLGAGFLTRMRRQDPTKMNPCRNPQANPGFVRSASDERLWARAKSEAARSYRVGSPSYWRVANMIFHRMKAARR